MSSTPPSSIFAPPHTSVTQTPDGSYLLECATPLGPYPDKLGELLHRWAARAPERTFLAERDAAGAWAQLTYAETLARVEALAQALLDRGLDRSRPVIALSGNSIDVALLQMAAMHVGVPAVLVSPAYSLLSNDHEKLKDVYRRIRPGLIYAQDAEAFAPALAAVSDGTEVVSADGRGPHVDTALEELTRTAPGPQVAARYTRVGPETIAKVLFTSGSTGMPKGVVNTQRMLCSNQQALAQIWPFLEDEPPVVLDWLPWSHTFGGNHNFNMVLRNGGTFYIDAGKPAPGAIDATVENLRAVSPTMYFNVPAGYQALLPYLEADAELRDRFFRRLRLVFYAGAALPQNLWERIEALARASGNDGIPLVTSWGTTETAPLATSVHYSIPRAGPIGVPVPGCRIRLVPASNDKLEIRVQGPNVTPGYWQDEDATSEAFDEQGYCRIGDLVRWVEPGRPEQGIAYAGRLAENFKLPSGTWVHVGELRLQLIAACSPVIADCVLTGEDRDEIGVLVFPNEPGCRSVAGPDAQDLPARSLWRCPAVLDHLRQGLEKHNRDNPGGSTRISRALILDRPPALDDGEITDKGYVNQRRVRAARAALVERLYAGGEGVLCL